MAAPVPLRSDFDAFQLRALAKVSRDPDQIRRLLALAEIYDGEPRGIAAKVGGVGLQTVRDWVVAFNADGPDGLINDKAPGAVSILNEAQRRELIAVVESGPIPAVHDVVRWRLADLTAWVYRTFGLSISRQTLGKELRAMGYRRISARPRHHAQSAEAIDIFKNSSPPVWTKLPAKRPVASR